MKTACEQRTLVSSEILPYPESMADPELVHVMDFILNRCNEAEIEAVAAAVVRRKKELSMFGSANMMDPKRWAHKTAESLSSGAGMGLDSVRSMVRDLVSGMLRKEAPELSEEQIEELLGAWVDGAAEGAAGQTEQKGSSQAGKRLSPGAARHMVEQFVSFSTGEMPEAEDQELREQLGDWPERYWKVLPDGVRAVVSDYLGGLLTHKAFQSQLITAIELGCGKG